MKKSHYFWVSLIITTVFAYTTVFLACDDDDDDNSGLTSRSDDDDTTVDDDDNDDDDTDDDDNDDEELSDAGETDDDDDDNNTTSPDDDDADDAGDEDNRIPPDAGNPSCDHDPKDCDYKPACTIDDDCPCAFVCTEGFCLSQHCYCANLRGEDPCGKEMECDEATGYCVMASAPCSSDADCYNKGSNWFCENGKCKRQDNSCSTSDPDACSDYAPAIYECINGICAGAGEHGDPCPNHVNYDCASGYICNNGACAKMCESIGQPCPPPLQDLNCVQQQVMGLPMGEAHCE